MLSSDWLILQMLSSDWLMANMYYTRSWMIRVTQYEDRQESSFVPPPGCLQYNYGSFLGTIQNFNFKDDSSYHLSNQRYSICWRRERSMCSLCFSAGFFGLSNVPSSVKPSPSSTSTSPWTKKAGYTDSICCNKDNKISNCGTSGWLTTRETENGELWMFQELEITLSSREHISPRPVQQ